MDTERNTDGNLRLQFPHRGSRGESLPSDTRRPLSNEAQKELDDLTSEYRLKIERDAQYLCHVSQADVVSAVHVQSAAVPHDMGRKPKFKRLAPIGGLLLGLALTLVFDPARWASMNGAIGIVATLSAGIGAALIGLSWAEDFRASRERNRKQ